MSDSSETAYKTKINKARAQLLIKQPFFGNLLLSLRMIERDDLEYKTMGVDGENIYYDKNFVDSLSLDELKGVLIHEVLHVAMCHLSRKKRYHDRKKWNVACDYAINPIIMSMTEVSLPSNVLFEKEFRDKSAEQIYSLLPPEEELTDKTDGKFMDDHMDMDDETEQRFIKRMVNVWDNMTPSEKARGDIPDSLRKIIDELKKPQYDWRKYIQATVESIFIRTDYSSARKSYMFQDICGEDAFFPKLMGKENSLLAVVIDTSGSISKKELQDFASEISGIAAIADKTIVLSCDAAVHDEVELTQFSDVLSSLKFSGGGGTDFCPAFEYLRDKRIQPECMIFLTDGWGRFPDCKPNYPVIWCLTPNHASADDFPFGEFVELKDLGDEQDN